MGFAPTSLDSTGELAQAHIERIDETHLMVMGRQTLCHSCSLMELFF